jgi:hypothetical protein
LPQLNKEFVALIPVQRLHVFALMNNGIIQNYALSGDRSKLWLVIEAKSKHEAEKVVKEFPIYPYMEYMVNELFYFEAASHNVPHFWLN